MKVLITGGAGFIGSTLSDRLIERGNQVVVIDNFNNYYNPQRKRKNIDEIYSKYNLQIENECYKLYEVDIRDKEGIERVFEENKNIDAVVHLAAMAGVRYSIENTKLYYDVNIMGTVNLLEIMKANNVMKLVFASSSSVYGNNKKVPFSESDAVDNPISPYAATKKSGELICYTYHHLYKMNVACLRFFTVYGPKQRPDLAIHKFYKLAKEGKSIPFYGDGSTMRDYTYIDDIVNGIMKSVQWLQSDELRYNVFNIGSGNPITLKQMVECIAEAMGKPIEIEKLPMQMGDVDRTYCDITKAKEVLGYEVSISFKEGIERFMKWAEEGDNK